MYDEKAAGPKSGQRLLPGLASNSRRQQRLMLVALVLLLVSLAAVLYRDRDFWFPDAEEADAGALATPEVQSTAPPVNASAATPVPQDTPVPHKKKTHRREVAPKVSQVSNDPPAAGTTVTRTFLPPLEVEVVAGDAHRTVRPGTNAVRVDLARAPAPSAPNSAFIPDGATETAARVATPAAQRTSLSANAAADIVSRSVQPDYPSLARQMRVQGSVVLQALIGRDGLIEDLRVLSGPPILARAAEEAVRQWHFKPHYVGSLPVETRASITVNFTISTN